MTTFLQHIPVNPTKEDRPIAAIYARSATEASLASEHPRRLAAQIEQCRQFCVTHGYQANERSLYQDIASGTDCRNRPALTALRLAAREHLFAVVVVLACDCLARDPILIAVLLEDLENIGIRVESVTEENCYGTHEWTSSLFIRSRLETVRSTVRRLTHPNPTTLFSGNAHPLLSRPHSLQQTPSE